MTQLRAMVIYEDSRNAVSPKQYGLHELVVACVADNLQRSVHELRRSSLANPRNGNDKVVEFCRRPALLNMSGPAIAVLDDDKIRDLPGMKKGFCKGQVIGALRTGKHQVPGGVEIVLLVGNVEEVLRAAEKHVPGISAERFARAIRKKSPVERDSILNSVAGNPDPKIRALILGEIPSLGRLVDKLAKLL